MTKTREKERREKKGLSACTLPEQRRAQAHELTRGEALSNKLLLLLTFFFSWVPTFFFRRRRRCRSRGRKIPFAAGITVREKL